MATATFERQAELLEQIHACARELRELAGDALEIIVKPAAATRPSGGDVVGEATVDQVRAVLTGEWQGPGDVQSASQLSAASVRRALRMLLERGEVEHNGKTRRGSAYRLAEQSPLPGGASSNGHPMSSRTRKSLERAEQQPVEPQPDPASPLERVRRACAEDAATLTELAMRLDMPRREVASAIEQLLDQDQVVKCGSRFPQKHVVYGAVA